MNEHDQMVQYGNWIPWNSLLRLWGVTGLLLLGLFLNIALKVSKLFSLLLGSGILMVGSIVIYLQYCHYVYSFRGGGVMGKIQNFLLSHLLWSGEGKLLEIGCGSGSLTILCARNFPNAEVTGTDLWEKGWGYSQEQCQRNAAYEGIVNAKFIPGNAAKLPFPDQTFDAVISNLVFHEVIQESNERKLVMEALRVLKEGGTFAFHDVFEEKRLYGDMQEFCESLRNQGVERVYYEPHSEEQAFVPWLLRKPVMLHNLGVLYGKK